MYISRKDANTAQKFHLDFGDGKDYYLSVLSGFSDEFRQAKNTISTVIAVSDEKINQIDMVERLLSSVIVDWKLPKDIKVGKCNPENAKKLLHEFPEICDKLNNFIAIKNNFIEKK